MPRFIAVILILIQGVLLFHLASQTSLNRTEVAHLGASAHFWQTGRYDLFHVNPPLGRVVAGLPIRLYGPNYDWKSYSPRPQDRSEWQVGAAFIAANEPNDVRWCYVLGRWFCLPVILLGGWYGFRLASELYGSRSGLVFGVLWVFSPLVLGWGATLCPDMMAASLGLIATWYFRRWLTAPSWKSAIPGGVLIGLLPLAKTTWIVAFGLFPLIWIATRNRPPWKQMVVVLLTSLYILNMGYLFDGSFRLLKDYMFISESLRGDGTNRFADSPLGYVPVPFPAEFVQGIDTQKRDFEKGLESYLFGEYRERGWRYYYCIVLALKEPLGTLLLAGLVLGLISCRREYRVSWNDELLVLSPLIVLFAVVSSQSGISVHPRYLLPALPFFYLLISRIGKAFEYKHRIIRGVAAICLAWMIASSLYVYPCSMSYFNEIIPVQKRPEVLLGSNLDWGQDAYFLKSWLAGHPEASPIRIEYPCPEGIERLGIESQGKPPSEPEPGWYALGVNDIYAAAEPYAWFKQCEPVAVVGYSIYIYHLTPDDVDRLTSNPER